MSPSSDSRRMYYVSTLENRIGGNGSGRGEAQIWIVPEGVIHNSYHPKKMKLPKGHSIQVSPYIAQNVLDGGSIKIQLDGSRQPKDFVGRYTMKVSSVTILRFITMIQTTIYDSKVIFLFPLVLKKYPKVALWIHLRTCQNICLLLQPALR